MIVVMAGRSSSVSGRKWEVRFLLAWLGSRRMGCCWDGEREWRRGGDREVVVEMRVRRLSSRMSSIMVALLEG